MRRIFAINVAAVLLLTATSGCGTLCNMTGHEACLLDIYPERPIAPFGGVGNDVRWMARGFEPEKPLPLAIVAAAIDMPFSLLGDVVTFPWAAYQSLIVVRPQPNSPRLGIADGAGGN